MKTLAGASLLLGIVLLVGPACSSLSSWSGPPEHQWVYSGTRTNIAAFDGRGEAHMQGFLRCIAVVDFPFSLALDTIALPVTFVLELFGRK
jgi:uncharacterized protein YceK